MASAKLQESLLAHVNNIETVKCQNNLSHILLY